MTVAKNVRRALLADAEAILAIAQGCAEAPHWSDAVWRQLLADQEESEPARACFLAEDHRGPFGFIVVSCTCGVAELESVAVNVAARRQGIGRALCCEAMSWSQGRAAQVIQLEVRASSLGAIALYSGLGFTEQGRRPGYYREPMEDAVLMSAGFACESPQQQALGVVCKRDRVAKV